MSKLREILLARAKEPAKLHPLDAQVPNCLPPIRHAPEKAKAVREAPDKPEVTQLPRLRQRSPPPPQQNRGKVPAYLKRRQAELAEQRRMAAQPKPPSVPPGYRLVPEEERQGTLSQLSARKAQVEAALRALPFKIETPGQRRRERELLTSLEQVDKLLQMFGHPTVFVPADAGPIPDTLPAVAGPRQAR
ncbi:unnamed protein product [Effrenium voratum]|nr:unnamed protein product [Effrenium voratum]